MVVPGCALEWGQHHDAPDAGAGTSLPDAGGPDTAILDAPPYAVVASSGTFGLQTAYATMDDEPQSIATGDLDGDGRPDVVVANHRHQGMDSNSIYIPGSVTTFLSTSTGALQFKQKLAVGYGPVAIELADFNGDHRLDLVTTNLAQGIGGNLSVALGNGDGTFAPSYAAAGCCSPQDVKAGDFNGDGKLDLAIANYQAAQIALGNGNGTFATPTSYAAQFGSMKLAIGDLDNNGKLDVVLPDYYYQAPSDLAVLLGNGNGTLQTAVHYHASQSYMVPAIDDLDHDGNLDVITANGVLSSITVLRGDGAGGLLAPTAYATGNTLNGIVVADLNGDRYADVAVASTDDSTVVVRLNNRDGTFGPAASYPTASAPFGIAAADVNHDGILDLITPNPVTDDVSVLFGQP
jgi:hypothetical protein